MINKLKVTFNESGIVHLVVLIVLLLGMGVAVYLVSYSEVYNNYVSASQGVDPTSGNLEVPVLAFVFTGESNSGGLAANSLAQSSELSPTTRVQVLNNNSLVFENLDIGTNNLIDHYGLTPAFSATAHGFELQLANLVKAGAFPNNPNVYLVKTGQGQSLLSQWNTGGSYWTKFQSRTTAAKTQISQPTQWIVWYSLGINDQIKKTSVNTFKSETIKHLNKIKAELPGAIIIMTQFQAMGADFNDYNNALSEIADSEPDVYVVNTVGTTLTRDGYHWEYSGYKEVVARMVETTKSALGIGTSFSASPNPCNLNSSTSCKSTIQWNFPGISNLLITIKESPGSRFATGSFGSQVAPWISASSLTFQAYSGRNLLGSMVVKGEKLAATPSATLFPTPTLTPTASPKPLVCGVPVESLVYNRNNLSRFYTTNKSLAETLTKNGWRAGGPAFWAYNFASIQNTVPVHSFYLKPGGVNEQDRLLTTFQPGFKALEDAGWVNEGKMFWVYNSSAIPKTVAVHSFVFRNTNSRYYTPDTTQFEALKDQGWKNEGPVFWAYKNLQDSCR